MNMVKKIFKKLSFVVILLLINSVKGSENLMDNYVSDATIKSLSTKKGDWYVDFTEYNIKNPCGYFNNSFAKTNINPKNKQFENTQKFIEFMLFLAQNSKQCWLSFIQKAKESYDPPFLFERMAHSALRTYIYLLIENKRKWQKTVSWWKSPWERAKLLYQGIPDVYLIAVAEEMRKIEHNSLKNISMQSRKTPYQDFLRDLPSKVREYLTNIPDELVKNLSPEQIKKLQFSEQEIQNIIKNLNAKLNPNFLRRHAKKIIITAAVVGVGYLLAKNKAEIKGEYKKGGIGGVTKYWWEGIKNAPDKLKESIFGKKETSFSKPEERKFLIVDTANLKIINKVYTGQLLFNKQKYEKILEGATKKGYLFGMIDPENKEKFIIYTMEEISNLLSSIKNSAKDSKEMQLVPEFFIVKEVKN